MSVPKRMADRTEDGGARVCRVLPDVRAVDRAFDYLLPRELGAAATVGTIVRVPLHGRRVRGWILELDVEPAVSRPDLLTVLAVVSAGPPNDLVELCAWAAWRWAGPRADFLRAASPPNVVAPGSETELDAAVFPAVASPLPVPDGEARVIRWPPAVSRVELVRSLAALEGSTIVIVPDPVEARVLAAAFEGEGREVLLVQGDQPAAERTEEWRAARRGACVVVGGRVAVFTPVPDLAQIVVLDDADDALKEERSPAWHARDLAVERARRLGVRCDVVSPVPTPESLGRADAIVAAVPHDEHAGWSRVEVVDLRDESPGIGLMSEALGHALRRALDEGGRALCVLNRRGRARLLACSSCRELARCEHCSAAVIETAAGLECPRCGWERPHVCQACGSSTLRAVRPGVTRVRDHVAALVPRATVVSVEAGSAPLPAYDVAVGTEAVLHRGRPTDDRAVRLVAFLDVDQELLAPRYRASEQALWLMVRASRLLGPRPHGGTLLVQTRLPKDLVVVAAQRGSPGPVIDAEIEHRKLLSFPPFGGLAEVTGEAAAVDLACAALRDARPPVDVLGPADRHGLVRGRTVDTVCDALAATDLGPARARGRLRVEVDPLRV
jgi:primosomal protein N' (replication factor Y) (superfamily II helicase)